jgi:hypothetical protein
VIHASGAEGGTPRLEASGVGVVDATTLWAAASQLSSGTGYVLLRGDEADPTGKRGFLSFLHSVVLYDELRADQSWFIDPEVPVFSEAVGETLSKLTSTVKFTGMPGDDREAMRLVLPAFVANVNDAANSRNPDTRSAGMLALDPARRYASAKADNKPLNPLLLPWEEGGWPKEWLDPEVRHEIEQLACDPRIWGRRFAGLRAREKEQGLLESLLVATRSVRYAAHTASIQKEERRPSAFCASPARLDILRGYLSRDALSSTEAGLNGFADLMPRLGLPTRGYDFTIMQDPLPLTVLSRAIQRLPPQEALERTIALRSTAEGRHLREAWAARIWDWSPQIIEGHARNVVGAFQAMRNVFAGGSISQTTNVDVKNVTVAIPAGTARSLPTGDGKILEEIGRAVIRELQRGP